MGDPLTKAVFDVMNNDTVLTDMLSTYNGIPAIFSMPFAPKNATRPYILSSGIVTSSDDSGLKFNGSVDVKDIRIYDDATGSESRIEDISNIVWELFHRKDLTVENRNTVNVFVSRPLAINSTEDEYYGRVISLSITIHN